jgi:hypothetical protein
MEAKEEIKKEEQIKGHLEKIKGKPFEKEDDK